nr:immunoglobulin light chain junction region [Macaca mulatta]MOW43845.1 immunoglobulin light chain junction region [Macaca mulatta]MOY03228.1 immunoglobulin light chain junction region [Macaca mulatta]MOY03763.1 immunoglobulin light chain junction region [Macaca mulatta]MOY03877.1 immunoglobulin light chain junction region [Macaca mulatta]
CLQGYTTPFTF